MGYEKEKEEEIKLTISEVSIWKTRILNRFMNGDLNSNYFKYVG